MTELLDEDEIQRRLQALQSNAVAHNPVVSAPVPARPAMESYRYLRPLHEAAEDLITSAFSEGRWLFGIPEIDNVIRGIGNGELMYVTGRAHSGKTQVVLNGINNDRSKRVIIFTPDETAELVLAKLVALRTGESGDLLEARLRARDESAMRLVREVSRKDFRHLLIFDDGLSLGQMTDAVAEAEDYWGAETDLIVFDFLELMRLDADGGDADVSRISRAAKAWGREIDRPLCVIHQANKKSGRGTRVGMDSMRFGGDTEATFVLGVWRKVDDEDLDDWERERWRDTITVAVAKNKRLPSKRGEWDFHLDQATGRIAPWDAYSGTGQPAPGRMLRSADEARAALRALQAEQGELL